MAYGDRIDTTTPALGLLDKGFPIEETVKELKRNIVDLRIKTLARDISVLTFGATVVVDVFKGDYLTLEVTSGAALTISDPTNPLEGRKITFDIFNNSGGAMGALTWGSEYKLAGAFTNPANGQHRLISYYRTGSMWREVSRTAADQPD